MSISNCLVIDGSIPPSTFNTLPYAHFHTECCTNFFPHFVHCTPHCTLQMHIIHMFYINCLLLLFTLHKEWQQCPLQIVFVHCTMQLVFANCTWPMVCQLYNICTLQCTLYTFFFYKLAPVIFFRLETLGWNNFLTLWLIFFQLWSCFHFLTGRRHLQPTAPASTPWLTRLTLYSPLYFCIHKIYLYACRRRCIYECIVYYVNPYFWGSTCSPMHLPELLWLRGCPHITSAAGGGGGGQANADDCWRRG